MVRDCRKLDGTALERARKSHKHTDITRRLNDGGSTHQTHAGNFTEVSNPRLDVPGLRSGSGAGHGGPKVDFRQQTDRTSKTIKILTECCRKAVKLLSERHRDGVLQLGAPHLENLVKLATLV